MYLSRLILNPRSRRVQREASDLYQMHRTLMRAFPDALAPGDERVLFRLEEAPHRPGLLLLVQSQSAPDWSWLTDPGAGGYLLSTNDANPWAKPFSPRLIAGQVFAFRLRANPTVKRERKRRGLCTPDSQLKWFSRKGENGGFRLLRAEARQEGSVRGVTHRNGCRHRFEFLSVRFDGLLQVTDPDLMLAALRNGIGSGKGLGFGLLSLARPT